MEEDLCINIDRDLQSRKIYLARVKKINLLYSYSKILLFSNKNKKHYLKTIILGEKETDKDWGVHALLVFKP